MTLAADQQGGLEALDWGVLALYGVVLIATGWWFNRRGARDTGEYFLGGRRMPVWAVSISVVATALSAATFVGGPQQAFAGNLTYLASNIGMVIAAVVVATVVIPALYRAGVATPYGLLEERIGGRARRWAAGFFLVGRVMASGARVYIIGIPAALILFGDAGDEAIPAWQIASAIGVTTAVGIVYTLIGGVRSVIWTDVIQMGVFLIAIASAIGLLVHAIPGGVGGAYEALAHETLEDGTRKLTVFDTSMSLTSNYSLLTCCTAFVLFGIASFGLDQDMVQRMLTCRSASRGAWSVIAANLASFPIVAMFLAVGLLLYVFYMRPDVMGDAAPGHGVSDSRKVFLTYILHELPAGLKGLMLAGLFAAGLSSLNSGLSSMSSTVVNDFYRKYAPGRTDRHYLWAGRACVVGWGVVLGGFAMVCIWWQRHEGGTLIDFALGVMVFAYAGLLGVFGTALLTKRGNDASAIAALIAGFGVILVLNKSAWGVVVGEEGLDRIPGWVSGAWGLAFAWKLAIGAGAAFGVCVIGTRGEAVPDQ